MLELARRNGAILVVDVVESVRLMEDDESGFIQRWRRFVHEVLADVLPCRQGRFVKSTGDGLMLRFPRADAAVDAAQAMQQRCERREQGLPAGGRMRLRMAAHVARYVEDAYDIYGTDINVTARLLDLAGAGELVVSAALRAELQVERPLQDLGRHPLRHVRESIQVFRLCLDRQATARVRARPPVFSAEFQLAASGY